MMQVSHPMCCRRRASSSTQSREYDRSRSDPYKRSIYGGGSVGPGLRAGSADR